MCLDCWEVCRVNKQCTVMEVGIKEQKETSQAGSQLFMP